MHNHKHDNEMSSQALSAKCAISVACSLAHSLCNQVEMR